MSREISRHSFDVPTRDGRTLAIAYERDVDLRKTIAIDFGDDPNHWFARPGTSSAQGSIPFFATTWTIEIPLAVALVLVDPIAVARRLLVDHEAACTISLPASAAQERGLIDADAVLWFPCVSFQVRKYYTARRVTIAHFAEAYCNAPYRPAPWVTNEALVNRLGDPCITKSELLSLRAILVEPAEQWLLLGRLSIADIETIPVADGWMPFVYEVHLHDDGVEVRFRGVRGTFARQYALLQHYLKSAYWRGDDVGGDTWTESPGLSLYERQFSGCRLQLHDTDPSERLDWSRPLSVHWLKWRASVERLVALVLATRSALIPTYCLLWIVEWLPFGRVTLHGRLIAFIEQCVESVKRVEHHRIAVQ